jgi:hypothetical protein
MGSIKTQLTLSTVKASFRSTRWDSSRIFNDLLTAHSRPTNTSHNLGGDHPLKNSTWCFRAKYEEVERALAAPSWKKRA